MRPVYSQHTTYVLKFRKNDWILLKRKVYAKRYRHANKNDKERNREKEREREHGLYLATSEQIRDFW